MEDEAFKFKSKNSCNVINKYIEHNSIVNYNKRRRRKKRERKIQRVLLKKWLKHILLLKNTNNKREPNIKKRVSQ